MSSGFVRLTETEVVGQRSTTIQSGSSQRDRPLLSPAKFIPKSSQSSNSSRPPSKWSPVLPDSNWNKLDSKTGK